jgi:UDP-N-acetylglucosamine--N-acetylmuramyl-(pentapeptide) pyrophosphoryl-undecaprenol N-acetylglucosamine transferase
MRGSRDWSPVCHPLSLIPYPSSIAKVPLLFPKRSLAATRSLRRGALGAIVVPTSIAHSAPLRKAFESRLNEVRLSTFLVVTDTAAAMKSSDPPTFLFAGGGTGGHLFPGIAVAEELLARISTARILFSGSQRDVESAIVRSAGFQHIALPSPPSTMLRRHPLRFAVQYLRASRDSRRIVAGNRPTAVIGLGGFASVPLVTAAKKAGVPIVLLEQNAIAGRATRRLARSANVICHTLRSAVPKGRAGRNAVVTGNPVRSAIAAMRTGNADDSRSTLLVLGGSQGSTAVNEAVISAADELREQLAGWKIVHQRGPNDGDRIAAAYRRLGIAHVVRPFFDDLPLRYATAGVAVSRAGATTLSELACVGVPAVLVPYPNAVHDHQQRNADVFAAAGAACVVRQQRTADETGGQLASALRPLLCDREERGRRAEAMHALAVRDAASRVADCVLTAAALPLSASAASAPHFIPAERIRADATTARR